MLFLFIFKLFFTGVSLIYNVVLVSAVQQSESVIQRHISHSLFFRFFLFGAILNGLIF